MFKRFQVLDLYFGDEETTIDKWIDVETKVPKVTNGVFRVKLNDSSEIDAYFMSDMACSLCLAAGIKPSYWWHRRMKEPIYNVVHWATKKKRD